jgi:hypothetical protein
MHSHAMHRCDLAIHSLAAVQAGAFARAQVHANGGDDSLITRRLRAGRWVKAAEGVYRLPGVPPTHERKLWIAHLAVGSGSVLSHECAAERRGLGAVPRGLIVLTSGRGDHHRIAGTFVHQLRDVLDHHVSIVGGLPTTTVARTLVDCAAVLSQTRLNHLTEQALNERKTTIPEIHRVIADIDRRGKPGMRPMGRALDRFGPANPVESNILERLLLDAVLGAGNPPPVAQFPHPGRHPGVGRVDFAYPSAKVILEADGRTWHQRSADVLRDRSRDLEAAREGWQTLRFMWEHLRDDPADAGATVRDVLAIRQSA